MTNYKGVDLHYSASIFSSPTYLRACFTVTWPDVHFTVTLLTDLSSIESPLCSQAAGSTLDGNTSTIIIGVVNFGSTFLATILIDRFGRKVLLYVSSVAMILSLMVLGTFFHLKEHTDTDVVPYGWLPLVSFVVYVIGFSFGFGPIPWLMMGEILPGKSPYTLYSIRQALF